MATNSNEIRGQVNALAEKIATLQRQGELDVALLLRFCFAGRLVEEAISMRFQAIVSSVTPGIVNDNLYSEGLSLDQHCKSFRGGSLAALVLRYLEFRLSGNASTHLASPVFEFGIRKMQQKLAAIGERGSRYTYSGTRKLGRIYRQMVESEGTRNVEEFCDPCQRFCALVLPGRHHEQEDASQEILLALTRSQVHSKVFLSNGNHIMRSTAREFRKTFWDYSSRFVSDSVLGGDDTISVMETIADDSNENELGSVELSSHLSELLETLPPLQSKIVEYRFGLNRERLTVRKIAKALGLERNSVNRMFNSAMKNLHNAAMKNGLGKYQHIGTSLRRTPRWLKELRKARPV